MTSRVATILLLGWSAVHASATTVELSEGTNIAVGVSPDE